ncbi:MAG: hypothetical protein LBS19_15540 [Clostridiales bacterium]|jgi:hypothetical protein|nr:hypothetical protein [Clostridiales bacterium]
MNNDIKDTAVSSPHSFISSGGLKVTTEYKGDKSVEDALLDYLVKYGLREEHDTYS